MWDFSLGFFLGRQVGMAPYCHDFIMFQFELILFEHVHSYSKKSVFRGAFIYHLATGIFCLVHSAMAFFVAVSFDRPVILFLGEGFGCISLCLFGVQKRGVSL